MTRKLSHGQAAAALAATIQRADSAIYSLRQREPQMLPKAYQRAVSDAKTEAREAIQQARADLDAAVARERQEAQRVTPPTGDAAARVTMYATQGMALAQAGLADLEQGMRDQLAAGNASAAREYLRAGGSRLRSHLRAENRGEDFRTLERATASEGTVKRAATVRGLDTYAEQIARLDGHLAGIVDRLGAGDVDPDDPAAERQDPSRVVSLWHDTAEQAAADAGVAEVQAYQAAQASTGLADL